MKIDMPEGLNGTDNTPVVRPASWLSSARVWLLTGICFALPMRVSFVYLLTALLLIVCLAEGRLLERLRAILSSRLCLAFLAYFAAFVLALLWTTDLPAGLQMVDRQTPMLLFLLYWTCAQPSHRDRYLSALIAGVAVCALLAHYNWMQLHWFPEWPRGIRVDKDPNDTAPFVDHIMYTPILALGAYFSLRRAVFETAMKGRILAAGISCLLLSNLMFSGGRAGMVMAGVLCVTLAFERIRAPRNALLFSVALFAASFTAVYSTQDYFAQRVDSAIQDIREFKTNPNTSVGQRLVYWTTSFRVFIRNPLTGVGSGDFPQEYVQAKPAHWATTPDTFNPHNQYLLVGATTGLLGLLALLALFYLAVRESRDTQTKAFLLAFAVVCMFESYLWRSNTAMAFSVILAVLLSGGRQYRMR